MFKKHYYLFSSFYVLNVFISFYLFFLFLSVFINNKSSSLVNNNNKLRARAHVHTYIYCVALYYLPV